MENKFSINVKNIYNETNYYNNSIMDIITHLNYYIINFIYKILYTESDIELCDIKPIFYWWCASIKKVENSEEKTYLYNDIVKYVDETSSAINNEFDSIKTIAYLIGTHTENDKPYTSNTLVALVCAILKKADINLIF